MRETASATVRPLLEDTTALAEPASSEEPPLVDWLMTVSRNWPPSSW